MALTQERIRALYARYRKLDPWKANWLVGLVEELDWAAGLDEAGLRTADAQRRLWSARKITGVGPGEGVGIGGAATDPAVVDALAGLRFAALPEEPSARAAAIQQSYDTVLGLVNPKHARFRPQAKLARILAGLLPAEMHTGCSWQSQRTIGRLLVDESGRAGVGTAVLARARLREVLEQEADIAEHAHRMAFCWWLFENVTAIERGEDPDAIGQGLVQPPPPPPPPPLAIWPGLKLRKGMPAWGGYSSTFREVVLAARNGATPDDIVATVRMAPGMDALSPLSVRAIFNAVRWLGLLEADGAVWRPSQDGERVVEEDPSDLLVERFLTQVFGIPHLLRKIASGPIGHRELYDHLRALYPNWTSDFAPSAQLAWAEDLGLVDKRSDGLRTITDYGKEWLSRLPPELPLPPAKAGPRPDVGSEDAPARPALPWPVTFENLWDGLGKLDAADRYVWDQGALRALHLAWHSQRDKRFVILSGLSGTGKTQILRRYAMAYLATLDLDLDRHLRTVAVAPDWRDPSGLLGYFNALHADPTFQAEPALRLVLAAARDPDRPYFLILDEMNLARVEQYFAPFLSAMETGDRLHIHAEDDEVNGVPSAIEWPSNLFIGGTVNMDETTHAISDKVLDRAFTLEFWDVDLATFFERRARANPGVHHQQAEAVLTAVHNELAKVRRHFGYRTADEVLSFLDGAAQSWGGAGGATAELLDHAMFSKVLPRIRGEDSPELLSALAAVHATCASAGLTRSAAKVKQMEQRLRSAGVTRFWA